MTESMIQGDSVTAIGMLYPELLISLSLSGVQFFGTPEQVSKQMTQLKKEGFRKGLPDILVYLPEGKVLNLEYKTPVGKQSEFQVEVQQILTELGHNYYLVKSIDDTLKALADNLSTDYRQKAYETAIHNPKLKKLLGSGIEIVLKLQFHL